MKLRAELSGLGSAQAYVDRLGGVAKRGAMVKALNDGGQFLRRAMQTEMRSVFDKPTDYILRSPRFKPATIDRLEVLVEPSYGGGKGIDPQRILDAQSFGGRRNDKRIESALRRVGILPAGYQTAMPKDPYPGSDDGRGNLRGAFVVQLISYFQAFGEQGYKANMTSRRQGAIHRGTVKQAGRRYFVSYGKLRDGGRSRHLAAGIWAAAGTGGVDVRPVVMFTKRGTYKPRLPMDKLAQKSGVTVYLARRLRFRIREAAGV
ncbi:hypothetical protein WAE61_18260 [Comamonadaceae bacterium PP-2]